MAIKYNSNTVNEMEYNTSPVKKVMYNSTVAYIRKVRENIYRWVVDGTVCDGYDEHQKLVKQVSIDGGDSWQTIIPEISMKGELIESASTECGYDTTFKSFDYYLTGHEIITIGCTNYLQPLLTGIKKIRFNVDEITTSTECNRLNLTDGTNAYDFYDNGQTSMSGVTKDIREFADDSGFTNVNWVNDKIIEFSTTTTLNYFETDFNKNYISLKAESGLPDVAFSFNYNVKDYDSTTYTFNKANGQLIDINLQIIGGTNTIVYNNDYITINDSVRGYIPSTWNQYLNRDSSNRPLTIITKAKSSGSNCHLFANRDSSYNYMYRQYSDHLTLHGGSETGRIDITDNTVPTILSIRVDSNGTLTYNNYNDNTSSETYFSYGNTNSDAASLFQGYASYSGEMFIGDFYWIYLSQNTLTDEQVQQVIDYNEGL